MEDSMLNGEKQYGSSSKKIKNRITIKSRNSPSDYPKEWKSGTWTDSCTFMFIIALLILARKAKATQVYTDGWMDKQNVAYTQSGILFSLLKKEGNSDTCYKTDYLEDIVPSEISQWLYKPVIY